MKNNKDKCSYIDRAKEFISEFNKDRRYTPLDSNERAAIAMFAEWLDKRGK